MCGICGVYQLNAEAIKPGTLSEMCGVLKHRGPDDEGFYFGPQIGLGHRRLSIIDLDSGHQPLTNEDESIWIVFNGEIYNHLELREDLEKKGHRFRTRSDTEVIVHLYEEYGAELLDKLRGMFAFALWDEKQRGLLLARDRLGQKPLYYSQQGNTFIFASEIKSILQHPLVQPEENLSAIYDFLNYQYVPSPQTAFAGIYKLPPASYLLYKGAEKKIERYWRLSFEQKLHLSEEEYCRRLRELMEEAVKIRLMSDVPLGAFLSGGLDSSAVVGLMSKLTSRPVKTFSIGFAEMEYNELEYARAVAEHFQTEHREFMVHPKALEALPKLIWHYNEPFADPSALPTYYVSKVSRQFVTVALCGDAGDENFAGYNRYMMHKQSLMYQKIPVFLREKFLAELTASWARALPDRQFFRRLNNLVKRLSMPTDVLHAEQMSIFSPQAKQELYSRKLSGAGDDKYFAELFNHTNGWDELDRVLWVDINSYLPDDLLIKVDVASMANSLEVRSPFLDHKVVEFAASIPSKFKVRGCKLKYILERAFAPMLPEAVLGRKKMGFSVPLESWFRGELKDYIHEILLDESSLKRGYFKPGAVEKLLAEHCGKKFDHSFKLWNLLMLELWQRMFIDPNNSGIRNYKTVIH